MSRKVRPPSSGEAEIMFTLGTRFLCTLSSANGTRIALKPLCLMKSKYQAIEWAQSPFGTISGSSAPNQLTPLSTTGCPAIRRVPPEAVKSGSALQSTDMRPEELEALCSGAPAPGAERPCSERARTPRGGPGGVRTDGYASLLETDKGGRTARGW